MSGQDATVEETILDAAEQLFLKKGFSATKTTDIATLAGVNHAMVHYYFRTKEHLFNTIFDKKAHVLAESFIQIVDEDIPFLEKIKLATQTHFDFIVSNPKLPLFMLNEVISSEDQREKLRKVLSPKLEPVLHKLQKTIEQEVANGSIQAISALDLMLNIISLNTFSVLFWSIHEDMLGLNIDQFLEKRKENNVRLVLKSLEL